MASLESLCKKGKCGLCCFNTLEFPGYYVISEKIAETVPRWKEFINKHKDKLNLKEGKYYTKLNTDIELRILWESNYPCSLLEIKLGGFHRDSVKSMKCSIYPKSGAGSQDDYRPGICNIHKVTEDPRDPPCYELLMRCIRSFCIKKKYCYLPKELLNKQPEIRKKDYTLYDLRVVLARLLNTHNEP